LLLRVGPPATVFFGVWYTGDFTKGIIQSFQEVLGVQEFLILLATIIVSTLITLGINTSNKGSSRSGSNGEVSKRQRAKTMRKNLTSPFASFDKIVGQDHVISPIKEIARLARAKIRVGKDNAPYAVVLFLGPTGVGKTEAARALAEAVYGSADSLIRFDMGQFADAHQANRFYGPPPGYVGYEQGGQLTRAVLRRPHSVILLDEVEKADPKIWDAFLPVFDEGYIVDGSSNQRVDMTNTIIVLTSNLLGDMPDVVKGSPLEIKEEVLKTGAFRTELIGRINDIFVFASLGKDTIREILIQRVDNALWSLASQGIKITIEHSEIEEMVEEVAAAKFGVRQIDDVLRTKIRAVLAKRNNTARVD